MPVWLESLLEILGEKLYIPNADKVRHGMIKSPLLVAILNIIPLFGVILTYGIVLGQLKFLVFIFADIFLLAALPVYPIYKLVTAIDVFLLTRKLKKGKEIGQWEFF
jgi:hypothetical protein